MFSNIFQNKRVLVTGHTGFKGSWLCLWLKKLGAEVCGISDEIFPWQNHFNELGLANEMESHLFDVRDRNKLQTVFNSFKPDIVFHLAAQAIVSRCFEDPCLAFDTNLMGTVNVLQGVRETPSISTAIFITSDKCYENVEWDYGYREHDRLGGKDPYSASKACAELAIYSFCQTYFKSQGKVKIASTRAGNVIGGGDWAPNRIVPDCIRSWNEDKSVEIRSPRATRPWQNVLEPLSGYLWLAACLEKGVEELNGEAFNFGPSTNDEFQVVELIEEMQKHWTGMKFNVNDPDNKSVKECGRLKLSCEKALSRLRWQATLNFKETVEMTVDWYKRFYDKQLPTKELSLQQITKYEEIASQRKAEWTK